MPSDGHLVLTDVISEISSQAFRLEWVIIAVVVSGESSCTINGKSYVLHAHDMVMCLPNTVLQRGDSSEDASVKCICISRQLLEKTISFSMYNWDVMSFLLSNPVLGLTGKEYFRFSLYHALMSEKLEDRQQLCYKESMQCLLKSFMYDFSAVIDRYVSVDIQSYTQGGKLFKHFLDLLTSNYPKPRSVSFYAGKLNVTPKYLSTVCKHCCGSTASAVIQKAVVKDIADLLAYSNKSIKEIMVELDFPSLSFFGKFVKKHLGAGPKEYRAKWLA